MANFVTFRIHGREHTLAPVGEYEGATVAIEPSDTLPAESAMVLAGLYVEAYRETFNEEPPALFNASYAQNNLFYLLREWEETGDLYRVAVPFTGASDVVKTAHNIALLRPLLAAPETTDNTVGPATRRLLDRALADEEKGV